jgi:excinuclease ABC subunit B
VLLGVTGSGKTFTMANVIAQLNRPTLVLTHNKTLTAQLYSELQSFFPDNAVEYFVSYYDYYQPEAYISVTDTYIEKDLQINELVDKLRLKATSTLLSGRRDIIIVASVSCIYGMGNPEDYKPASFAFFKGMKLSKTQFSVRLTDSLYARTETDFPAPPSACAATRWTSTCPTPTGATASFSGATRSKASKASKPSAANAYKVWKRCRHFPANLYIAPKDRLNEILNDIQDEMSAQEKYFIREGRLQEARRIKERTTFDIEMIRELGYCSGIENYSRFFDRREPGPPLLPARLFPRRLPDDRGRKPRDHPASARHVGRRPRPQAIARQLGLPPALGHRQPPAQFRGV